VIAAVMTALDEADIIGKCVEHHLNEGVDRIFVAVGPCQDDTEAILRRFPEVMIFDASRDTESRQQYWGDRLAASAAAVGAEWILPIDADEFWAHPGFTLAELFAEIVPNVGRVVFEWRQHRDWQHTLDYDPENLPKVAYRWHPSARIGPGNHTVWGAPVGEAFHGVAHHLRYRSREQMASKIRSRSARLPQWERELGHGWHITQHDGATDAELTALWEAHITAPAHFDPIPLRGPS
jgi:hypothetical protein